MEKGKNKYKTFSIILIILIIILIAFLHLLDKVTGNLKPVLYLYSKESLPVKVTFSHPEYLTTTYPKYFDKWEVIANKDGSLYDKSGKYYYALYWEEENSFVSDFKEGFYVTKENAIDFLEEKLRMIGLNDRERNEFIMYWLPILEKNEKSLVTFKYTDELQNVNELKIEPKPDSFLRVRMYVKKVHEEVSIQEQKIEPFQRSGFTAIEWGGVIVE